MTVSRDFPGGPVAGAPCSQRRGPGFDPRSGSWISRATTRSSPAATKVPACRSWGSHTLQLRIPHATTRTQYSRINRWVDGYFKKKECQPYYYSRYQVNFLRKHYLCFQKWRTIFVPIVLGGRVIHEQMSFVFKCFMSDTQLQFWITFLYPGRKEDQCLLTLL